MGGFSKNRRKIALIVCIHACMVCICEMGTNIKVEINRKLTSEFIVSTIEEGALHKCADRCVFITKCWSFSFNYKSKLCEFYLKNYTGSEPTDIITENNALLMDIVNWPAFRTGNCWNKPCGEDATCVPLKDFYKCHNQEHHVTLSNNVSGCKLYTLPEHGIFVNNDSIPITPTAIVYPVDTTLNVRCEEPFFTKKINPDAFWKTKCGVNYRWSFNLQCYKTEEFCTHHILQTTYYNGTATINVTAPGPDWDPNVVLFSSTQGWISALNDDQQFLHFQFIDRLWIGGITTKGGANGNWVKSFRMSYSQLCWHGNYYNVTAADSTQMFTGNTDANSAVTNYFYLPIFIRCLRLHPQDYENGITIRVEILGCKNYGLE